MERGARKPLQCIVRLSAHRRGRQRENPPFQLNNITAVQRYLQQWQPGTLGAVLLILQWQPNTHRVSVIVVLTSHQINARGCFSHLQIPSHSDCLSKCTGYKLDLISDITGNILLILIPIIIKKKDICLNNANNASSHLYLVLIYFPQAY